jgi:hypothetical protein
MRQPLADLTAVLGGFLFAAIALAGFKASLCANRFFS